MHSTKTKENDEDSKAVMKKKKKKKNGNCYHSLVGTNNMHQMDNKLHPLKVN